MKISNFNKKLIYLSLTYLLFLFRNFSNLKCDDFNNFNFDEISFDDLEKIETKGNGEDLKKSIVNVIEKIETPLWKKTKQPKGRDILYLLPHKLTAIEYGGFIVNIFFNYTNKMCFSPNETLKLSENEAAFQALIEELNNTVSNKQSSSLIPLFKKLTIQERKAGTLLQAGFITGAYTFQLNTSLQISERNFWLNKKDRDQIKNMFESSGSLFDEKELYKIKYGLGNTRIKIGMNTLNTSSIQLDIGIETILPTSQVSYIKDKDKINLEDLENSVTYLLNSIRDNLINPNLGNNGHYGIGCYIETKISLFHNLITLWNRISFDNLFSSKEDRLILSKQTLPKPIDLPYNFLKNNFTKIIKQYIFPPPYTLDVKPGGIINFVLNTTFNINKKWSIGIGYDFYSQQKECFDKIYNFDDDINTLRIQDAASNNIVQHKIFTETNYIKKQHRWNLNLGFGGDYTISAKEIGHDWTIFLRIGASF
ncbi:hypothetical protein KAT08_01330 [Candidatus Babeliales bacterium]|nr:hypothetical protein [Candidatus Babeliales bacterium]